jgi:glutamine synthetase
VVREHGAGQIELIFRERQQLWALVEAVTEARCTLASFAADCGYTLSLAPKPFADQPGNGQHVHLSLMDVHGQNVFFKRDDVISEALNFALGGLMAALPESMVFFAPSEASYARFCGSKDAPTTISWGANNRTTALRLPESRDGLKHIEHRVPGSDASLPEIIYAILAAVHAGLTRESPPPPQTYGDAFAAHYALPLLPKTYREAEMALKNTLFLRGYYPA